MLGDNLLDPGFQQFLLWTVPIWCPFSPQWKHLPSFKYSRIWSAEKGLRLLVLELVPEPGFEFCIVLVGLGVPRGLVEVGLGFVFSRSSRDFFH